MKEFLANGFFYLAVAALITLILLPILYSAPCAGERKMSRCGNLFCVILTCGRAF